MRIAVCAAITLGFLIAFAGRPVAILSQAALDDALFARLGQSLAAGRWLGVYDERTLVKGPGFPAFLALANLFSLAYPLALALFHIAASAFAARVTAIRLAAPWAGVWLFVLLLLLPPLYFGDALRISREVFYTSLTLALVAAVMAFSAPDGTRWRSGLLAGVLGAWWWLTREEGVWLVPTLLLIAAAPLLGKASLRTRIQRAAPAATAVALAAALVVVFGLVNAAVYGRFVVNEVKDKAFQSALSALQEAAAPYHRDMVPVPHAARAAIYPVSPAFASLRTPVLDGERTAGWTAHGCTLDSRICGDFGGGWFFWAVREAAAARGEHSDPARAAVFYRRIASEVEKGCHDGRLSCTPWHVPMIPPTRADQIDDILHSVGRAARVLSFTQSVDVETPFSNLDAPDAGQILAFVGSPPVIDTRQTLRLHGWFRGEGAEWFALQPGPGVEILSLNRLDSPDLPPHFNDPRLVAQRFDLEIGCPARAACPAVLVRSGGGAQEVDFATLRPGGDEVAGGWLQIDALVVEGGHPTTLKAAFSAAWSRFAGALNPLYATLAVGGAITWLALICDDLRRRRLTYISVLATALAGAVVARMLVLALIDALSFPAADHAYALPAAPLIVLFAVATLTAAAQRLAVLRT